MAVDFMLSVPPVPSLDIGASEKYENRHREAFKNTETLVSVKCNGRGFV